MCSIDVDQLDTAKYLKVRKSMGFVRDIYYFKVWTSKGCDQIYFNNLVYIIRVQIPMTHLMYNGSGHLPIIADVFLFW